MLKRCLSPLTLVNQVALIVLLSTAIGLAGMAVSGALLRVPYSFMVPIFGGRRWTAFSTG
ncbi:hypothetical protein IBK38_22660, partial [Escherichia coli]